MWERHLAVDTASTLQRSPDHDDRSRSHTPSDERPMCTVSHPFAFDVLVSSRIDDLRSEADQDYRFALARSSFRRKSPVAAIASLLWSHLFSPPHAAAAANL